MNSNRFFIKNIALAVLACLFACMDVHAQHRDNLDDFNYSYARQFYFKLDKSNIDESIRDNAQAIDSILYKLRDLKSYGAQNIRIRVIGSASLEASEEYNKRLASDRANNIVDHLRRYTLLKGVDIYTLEGLYDWTVLRDKVAQSSCPYHDELLEIMHTGRLTVGERKMLIQKLGNGTAYEYLKNNFFTYMRYADIRITAKVKDGLMKSDNRDELLVSDGSNNYYDNGNRGNGNGNGNGNGADFGNRNDNGNANGLDNGNGDGDGKRKFMIGVRSNLLYDVAATPNIGVDVYLSKKVSLGVNWMGSWWNSGKEHRYWRTYGGDIHADYWFNPTKKWTGHHLGIYGQMATFDYEWKNTGYQMPDYGFGGGIDYGYAVGLGKHFSLDFNIGIGYFGGTYHEYTPSETEFDHYYIENTKKLNWFGPTKLEISLIWKIGRE